MSEERISLSNQQVAPGETGYVPPTEAVPLPSKGRVYPPGHPLHEKELVEIRSMTARDEDILTSPALLKQGKAVDALLRSCVLDRSVNPEQMLVGDRNAILIAIRVTGYGKEYKAQVECPRCEEKTSAEFDLGRLPIVPLGAEPVHPGENLFSKDLPVLKKRVLFRLATGETESRISEVLSRSKKAAGPLAVETAVTTRLLHQVVAVGDETDPSKLARLIRDLPARDSRELRIHMGQVKPDVDMRQEFRCPACGETSEVSVPLGTEFFWPSGS